MLLELVTLLFVIQFSMFFGLIRLLLDIEFLILFEVVKVGCHCLRAI